MTFRYSLKPREGADGSKTKAVEFLENYIKADIRIAVDNLIRAVNEAKDLVPLLEVEATKPLQLVLSYLDLFHPVSPGRNALVPMRTMVEASWDMVNCSIIYPDNYTLPMQYARTIQVINNAIEMYDAWFSDWNSTPKEK
jgi:hypothetical protein